MHSAFYNDALHRNKSTGSYFKQIIAWLQLSKLGSVDARVICCLKLERFIKLAAERTCIVIIHYKKQIKTGLNLQRKTKKYFYSTKVNLTKSNHTIKMYSTHCNIRNQPIDKLLNLEVYSPYLRLYFQTALLYLPPHSGEDLPTGSSRRP